ncbi:MAG: Ig-like domain-containing protein, partial [Desulfurococcaceae archaeon]
IATKNRGGKDPEEGFGLLQIDAAVDAVTKEYTIGTYVAESLYSDPFSRHVWARKVYLTAGHTYTFELTVPGTADFDIYLWAWNPKPATTSPYGTWGEPLLVAWSNVTSEGGDEAIVYTPSTSGWYILTIKQISGYGTFQLESYEQINPPTCTITSPTTGSTVSGTITVQVSASDVSPGYVTSVTLYIDGGSPRSMTYNSATGKWEASVDTTALSEGQHVLRAKAVDNEGNIGWSNIVEIFVDNYPAKVLLVDDDAGASYETYYKKALEDLEIDYDYYSVPSGANGPGTTVLNNYPFVIWFTGDDYQTTLTSTDQTNLGTYLNNGGRLFISGQDIGYDLGAGNSFMNTYLAANYVGDSAASSIVNGQTGTVFDGVTYYLSGGDGANNNAYPDYVNLYDAPGTEAIALKYHNGRNASIVHDSGTYRTVYFAFPFEAINSRDARKDAMKRALIYLGYDFPPEVVIVSPPPDVGTNTGSITVVWNATDDYDIASHAVYLDGNLIATIDEPGTQTSVQRSYTITGLSDGLHTVRIRVKDSAGQYAYKEVTFWADSTPPTVSITSPSSGTWYTTPTITIQWSASDNFELDHHEIRVVGGSYDSGWINVGLNTSYTITLPTDGSYTVTVKTYDRATNTATSTITIGLDRIPPTVSIESPSSGTWLNTRDVTVTWSGSDSLSGIHHYEIRIDGGSWINVGASTSYIFTNLAEGTHTVEVKAVDKVGNTATSTITVGVDVTPPTVSVTSPPSGTWYNTRDVTVTWSGSDSLSGIHHYEIRINGGSWINVGTSTSYTFTNLAEGTHTIEVKAVDMAGNTATSTITVGVDVTPPTVSITSPQNGSTTSSNTVTVEWSGSDALSGINHYEVRCYNSTWDSGWINVGTSTSYTFANLAGGDYTVEVRAYDNAGNAKVTYVTFSIGVFRIVNPGRDPSTQAAYVASNTATISWTSTSANYYEIYVNGTYIGSTTSTSYTLSLSEGIYNITVVAMGSTGSIGQDSLIIIIDLTPPALTLQTTTLIANSQTTQVSVAWSGNDALSGIDHYEIKIGSSWINVGSNTSYTIDTSTLPEGRYTIYVRAFDRSGNYKQSYAILIVDRTAPTITVSYPSDGAVLSTGDITVSWTGSDSSGIAYYEVKVDSGQFIRVGKATSYYLSFGEGIHTITIRAYDTLGNYAEVTITIKVDLTPPDLEITSPADGAIIASGTVTVTWSSSS